MRALAPKLGWIAALVWLWSACGDAPTVPADGEDARQDLADAGEVGDAAGDLAEDTAADSLEDGPPSDGSGDADVSVGDASDTGVGDTGEGDTVEGDGVDLADEPDVAQADAPVFDADAAGDASADMSVGVTNLVAVASAANVLSYYVGWITDAPHPSALDVVCDEELSFRVADSTRRTRHSVFVMGLYTGAHCRFTVVGGEGEEATTTVEVEELPDFLPELTMGENDLAATSPGWTIFNLNNEFERVPLKIAMVDEQGRYRWYHSRAASGPGQDADVRVVDEGVLVGGWGAGTRPAIIDWEGGIVWEETIGGHHHVELTPDGEGILMLHEGGECPSGNSAAILSEWDRAAGDYAWRWALCEHFEPEGAGPDWSHINTIEPYTEPGQYLLSSRNLDSLLLVDPFAEEPSESIVWMLGATGDFTPLRPEGAPDPAFYHQHDPELQGDGRILMFDNGLAGVRETSRLLEIAYDDEAMTWEATWEYVPDPAIFAPIWGDADRLANGNVMGVFGQRGVDPSEMTEVHEVTPEGELVWSFRLPPRWGIYRAERVVDPPMGYVLPEGE